MHGRSFFKIVGLMLLAVVLSSCAHRGHRGPLVPVEPTIRFLSFNSVSIQPTGLRFVVKMELKNNMPVTIPLDRIDYQFDLNNRRLATGSFTEFVSFKGRGRQVVTFPFHIAFEDVVAHALARPEGLAYQVDFYGDLYVGGDFPFTTIPFSIARTIPVPRLPEVTIVGTEGSPVDEMFVIKLKIKNANNFPIWVKSVNTKLELNRADYDLFQSGITPRLEAGETQTLALKMTNPLGKSVGMLANVLISGRMDLKVGGNVRFGTPYGDLYLSIDRSVNQNGLRY